MPVRFKIHPALMALSEELPLYRDTLRLLNLTIEKVKSYPRYYRYTLGERMVNVNLDMLSLIYEANSTYDKIPVLGVFLNKYHLMTMLFRVCVEQHVINERQYANILIIIDGNRITRLSFQHPFPCRYNFYQFVIIKY